MEGETHPERRHGAEPQERFRLMVESVRDYAIFTLDPQGRVQTWNMGAERAKGYLAEEIIGQHISRFYTPEDVAAGRPQHLLREAEQAGRVEDEGWRVRKDGTRFWADVVITAVRDAAGQLLGFAKVTRDMTNHREAHEERVRLAQAQEAIRLRDEFLSIAAHELRTPLTALQLHLQGMRTRAKGLDPRLLTSLDQASRSSSRLNDLIESLLDVSRISTGHFELCPETCDLSSLVGEVAERHRAASERAGCQLDVRIEQGIVGCWDPLRLEQVASNLVSNALKYAAGTQVCISLSRQDGEAVLEVADRGPGVAQADLPRLFGRFERAAPLRHFGGMGLGLYVTREIAEAHGGSASARNRRGGGAAFTVRLPLAPTPALAGGEPVGRGEGEGAA